ncbi:uncharacterized protein M6B38_260360 [Iris pallida]|uniref:Uncharacterized protein n=1 Tax=Iris pallida TaxID=29817 RepID=A0AAX6IG42_IRIPA|nr:uncharacterized protein M6B38_260360 [Iris pallida]
MTMSRRYLSSLTEAMNLDSRSSLDEKPSLRLCLITSPASTSTSPIALRSSLSDPQSSSRFAFHTSGEVAVARLAERLVARSKAAANSDIGRERSRQAGSSPKEILHMVSKEKRRKMSWRSIVPRLAETESRRGRRRVRTSLETMREALERTELLPSSRLAILRWKFQSSPSALKIPSPRRSPRMEEKAFPLGKLLKLVLSMYSTLSGLAVTMLLRTWMWMVCVGEWRRRWAYQSTRLAKSAVHEELR